MAVPGASRKMITRAWWHGMSSEEESRSLLQSRLLVLSQLMFWSYGVLLLLMYGLYATYPRIEPQYNNYIYGLGVFGMLLLVTIWRGFLVRRALSMRGLFAVDIIYGAASGLIFAASAVIAYDRYMAMLANVLWTCFFVFLRTIIVPSTGERTAIVSSITLAPIVAAAAILPFMPRPQEFPLLALVGSTLLVAVLVVVLVTFGSRFIYGLRLQANAAMRLGQYVLGEKIGEGGNGAVYRAHHALLRRPTAIKLIRPEKVDSLTLDRFEREVQHMAGLTHPNTVAVYDYGRSPEGMFYYAMEYLDGVDLQKLVESYGPQPSDRVISILVQVCGALQEAHNRGVVHRDITPRNIILCERGDVPDVAKVVDFGLVKEITASDPNQTGRIFGTPAYIAPECITDPDLLGPHIDLYSLGAVGYYLVAGKKVFDGKNEVDACIQHVTAIPQKPSEIVPGIAPELEALILRCLAKKPQERPASAGELASLLRAIPSGNTWGEAEASKWWRELKAGPVSSEERTQTITITVDLGGRAANDEAPDLRKLSRRA